MENIISTRQAAKILQVSDRRIRALIESGKLKATKVNNFMWIINERDLDKVKDRRSGRPRKSPRDSLREAKGGVPARLPVGKPSGRK